MIIFLISVISNLLIRIPNNRTQSSKVIVLISWTFTILLGVWAIGFLMRYPILLKSIQNSENIDYAEVLKSQSGYLLLDGHIGRKSSDSLKNILKTEYGNVLVLTSKGGQLDDAKKMANLVRQGNLDVIVLSECYSACVLIAVAAKRLVASKTAKFGFHQASIFGDDKFNFSRYLAKNATDEMIKDLREGGVPETILTLAKKTPKSEMYYVMAIELKKLGMKIQIIESR